MFVDTVVQEIRDNGARIAEECGGDVHRMAERLRSEQAANADRVVSRKAKRSDPHTPQG
jgi:hypothetical protein